MTKIVDQFKLKGSADDKIDVTEKIGIRFQKGGKHCGEKEKMLISGTLSFSHIVFKRFLTQGCENPGLFGEGLRIS